MKKLINNYMKLIVITTFFALLFREYSIVTGSIKTLVINVDLLLVNTFILVIITTLITAIELLEVIELLSWKWIAIKTTIRIESKQIAEYLCGLQSSIPNTITFKELCIYRC